MELAHEKGCPSPACSADMIASTLHSLQSTPERERALGATPVISEWCVSGLDLARAVAPVVCSSDISFSAENATLSGMWLVFSEFQIKSTVPR